MKTLVRKMAKSTALLALLGTAGVAQADATFYNVTANYQGYEREIWLTAANGFAYCEARGYRVMVAFTGVCGEDESAYLDHVFGTTTWIPRSSGSRNGCYPLFSSITCR
ncbi:hypothetical protein A176_003020 [Myxococcus hansupus]|uniref:Uncharacterized protein n=1 Tax=Pseudomyxococcus hansupus TaxID=1297742 RepID=A0A0H4WWW9_9BACT|nr:hypothetical protein [Myxococcus hansupus]AKQ66108.1 hypothetical protein A176_003020 [Myxococcus hansupus]